MRKLLILLIALLLKGELFAAAYFMPFRGAESAAMGGTGIAHSNTMISSAINPANLLIGYSKDKAEKLDYALDVGITSQSISFERSNAYFSRNSNKDEASKLLPQSFGISENQAPPMPSPSFFLRYGINEKSAIGFSLFAPYGSVQKFSPDGSQRYLVVKNESILFFTGFPYAYKITPEITLGIMPGFSHAFFRNDIAFSGEPGLRPIRVREDPDYDHYSFIESYQLFVPKISFGIRYEPEADFKLAISFSSGEDYESEGSISFQKSANYFFKSTRFPGQEGVAPADLVLTANFPWQFHSHISYLAAPKWTFELGYTIEGWSSHEKIELISKDAAVENPIGIDRYELADQILEKNFENSHAFKMGISFDKNKDQSYMGGFGYETSAIPAEWLSLQSVDANKFWLSLGARLPFLEKKSVISISYIFYPETIVSNGQVRSLNPTYKSGEIFGRPVQNDGKYSFSTLIIGLSLSD